MMQFPSDERKMLLRAIRDDYEDFYTNITVTARRASPCR